MFDYAAIRDTVASPLIDQFGTDAQLLIPGAPTGSPFDPVPGIPVLVPVRIVNTKYSMTNRNETLVKVGDKMGLMSAAHGIAPDKTAHKLIIDGEQWNFVDVMVVSPGPTEVLYKFHVRK